MNGTWISRMTWIIHPYCWSMSSERPPRDLDGTAGAAWLACLAREERLHLFHMEYVSRMGKDEALVILPIGESDLMRRLIAHAGATLGPRCLIPEWHGAGTGFIEAVPDAMRRWVPGEALPGKQEWLDTFLTDGGRRPYNATYAAEMEAEIEAACAAIGYDWSPAALKVLYWNRGTAIALQELVQQRGLHYDPAMLKQVAFGEGFEQCALTWKAMIQHFLRLTHPIENDYDLSVSGFPPIIEARLLGRVALGGNTRLFLWENHCGEMVALYCQAAATLADPYRYACLPREAFPFEVRDVANQRYWPDGSLDVADGCVKVPVLDGLRRAPWGGYIVAHDVSADLFREVMTSVRIVESWSASGNKED